MSGLRRLAVPIGIVATVLLALLVQPWFEVEGTIRSVVTVAFWVSFIVLLVALFEERKNPESQEVEVEGPAFVRFLFNNSRAGLLWLPIRLFVGFSWLEAGLHHLSDPKWTTNGESLRQYWERAAALPEQGRPPISYEWYRDFINFLLAGHHETWFSWLIAFGEIAVAIGLIFGILTG